MVQKPWFLGKNWAEDLREALSQWRRSSRHLAEKFQAEVKPCPAHYSKFKPVPFISHSLLSSPETREGDKEIEGDSLWEGDLGGNLIMGECPLVCCIYLL